MHKLICALFSHYHKSQFSHFATKLSLLDRFFTFEYKLVKLFSCVTSAVQSEKRSSG